MLLTLHLDKMIELEVFSIDVDILLTELGGPRGCISDACRLIHHLYFLGLNDVFVGVIEVMAVTLGMVKD